MTTFPTEGYGPWLEAIACYGVGHATIYFNGGGDDGQVQDISVTGLVEALNINEVALLPEHVELSGHIGNELTLHRLLEVFAYEVLDRCGHDWVNNDGGYGEIRIEPGTGTVFLEMNIRETTSSLHEIDYSVEVNPDA